MRFTAVMRTFMLSGVAVEASNAALGAWTRLLSYAASDGIESPRLAGARTWNPRLWLVNCQLAASDVEDVVAAKLARWDSDDLLLEGFDVAGVEAMQKKRAQGHHGVGQGHHGIKGKPKAPPQGGAQREPEGGPISGHSTPVHSTSDAPAGAGADPGTRLYCEYHRRGAHTVRKLPPDGPVNGCPTCKHLDAARGTRRGEPASSAALLVAIAEEPRAAS